MYNHIMISSYMPLFGDPNVEVFSSTALPESRHWAAAPLVPEADLVVALALQVSGGHQLLEISGISQENVESETSHSFE